MDIMDYRGSPTIYHGTIHLPKELKAELGLKDGDVLLFHKTKKCGVVVEKSVEDE